MDILLSLTVSIVLVAYVLVIFDTAIMSVLFILKQRAKKIQRMIDGK
jgi:hypothetical protein